MTEAPLRVDHTLTAEQRAVVDQPWNKYVLVAAGAGSGKTYTMVRRLDTLVQRDELQAREILALSFSRAAVRELTRRIARDAESARRVRVQTFDGWATSLLVELDPAGDWRARPFDERIRRTTEAIDRGWIDEWYIEDLAHILIDEVQDLVGVRREMVETLIDRFPHAGFTVVGDAAQAIYGFQEPDPVERAMETNRFFDWLRRSYGDDLVELPLTKNFRFREHVTPEVQAAAELGPEVQAIGAESESAEVYHRKLSGLMADVPSLGAVDDEFVIDMLSGYPGTCAILTRYNSQALLVSEILNRHRVPHELQRSSWDKPVPAWMEALFRDALTSVVDRVRVQALVDEHLEGADVTADEVWRALRGMGRGPGRDVPLDSIRQAIAGHWVPDALATQPTARLVVSTVHRAKGLEFDRVLVVEPRPLRVPKDDRDRARYDPAVEVRLLYVAMTRPREDLYRLSEPVGVWTVLKDDRIGRWYVGNRNKWYVRNGIEALGDEVARDQPPGSVGVDSPRSALDIQAYLRTEVSPGDALEFRRSEETSLEESQSPQYIVFHDEQPVGVASERLRTDLYRLFKQSKSFEPHRWPQRIIGMTVDTLETVAGSVAAGERAGFGPWGVWLVPRLRGLGRFDWGSKASEGTDDDVEA